MAELIPEDVDAAIARLERDRRPYVLATLVWTAGSGSAKAGSRAVVTPDGQLRGWVGGACTLGAVVNTSREALELGQPLMLRVGPEGTTPPAWTDDDNRRARKSNCASKGIYELFIEPRPPVPQLVILGDTMLAARLGRLAKAIDYRVVASVKGPQTEHDRPEVDLLVTDASLDGITIDDETFVVVAGMGQWDKKAVALAVASDAEFVAVVASPKRWASLREHLSVSFPAEALDRVIAPAGLDLGRLTHEEIAVSILAQIVQTRAARREPA